MHSSFLHKPADDNIWSCSNRRHRLAWEGEEKQGGVQEQGQEDDRGERGRVTRVRMEGGGETRLWLLFGDKGL